MSSPRDLHKDLRNALKRGVFVRLERGDLEAGHLDGKVIALGSRIVGISLLGDDVRPNGLTFLRVSDITKIAAPAPYADFYARALRARRLRLPRQLRGPMQSWPAVLKFAAARHPLLTVHTEESNAEVCYVGKLQRVGGARCVLTGIGPDAKWELSEPLVVPLREVTRVDCGGAYEEALALVAGPLGE